MKVIVGLGNPGHTFHATRHNVGFRAIQVLAQRHQVDIGQRTSSPLDGRPAGVYGEYGSGAQRIRLLMPLTMMNESGEALQGLDVPMQDLLIVCDDVNLPLGTLRLRPQGGAGGHHGLESCLAALSTQDVARLRIGVGTATLPSDLHHFVLSPFTAQERPTIDQVIQQAADACETWTCDGLEAAMNRFNS